MTEKEKLSSTFSQQNKVQNLKNSSIFDSQMVKMSTEQLQIADQSELLAFFQSQCKKSMKSYLKFLRRNKTFDFKNVYSQMICCLSKIFSNSQNDNYEEKTACSLSRILQKSLKKDTNNSYLIFQLREKQQPMFVRVLSRARSIQGQQQIMTIIKILSLERNIVYTKIGPYNEQFLSQELQNTCNKFNLILTIVDNFIDNRSPNEELQKLVEKFNRTDTISQQQISSYFEKNDIKMNDYSIIKSILNTVKEVEREKRFIFQFLKSKGNNQSIVQTLAEVHLFTLYFNIKSLIVRLFEKNKLIAYQAFQSTISKSILKYIDPNYEQNAKGKLQNGHYPLKLKNAMLCQRCRRKRTYLYCQQCTNIQDKFISLCLRCYKVFHLDKSKQFQPIESKQQFIQVQTWKKIDLQIQAELNNSFLQFFGSNYLR